MADNQPEMYGDLTDTSTSWKDLEIVYRNFEICTDIWRVVSHVPVICLSTGCCQVLHVQQKHLAI